MNSDGSKLIWIAVGGVLTLLIVIWRKIQNSSSNTQNRKHENLLLTLKNPHIKYSFRLAFKENLNDKTRRFRFELPSSVHVLGVPIGQHIYLSAIINGELVKRPYNPITSNDNHGYFDLIVKMYPNGQMSSYLDKLPLGHTIDVNGPAGSFSYCGYGLFNIQSLTNPSSVSRRFRRLGFIAGGTGITAIYPIINEICKEQTSKSSNEMNDLHLWLLYANRSEQDILLRDDLEQLQHQNSERFQLWFTIDELIDQSLLWNYSKGLIDHNLLENHLPTANDETLICICGPTNMIQQSCLHNLHRLGFTQSMIYVF